MTRMQRIFADLIRVNPPDPRHPRAIVSEQDVPLLGFTWYSLNDQVDWNTALREDNGTVNALGLVDMDRKLRPVGRAYKKIIEQWAPVLEREPLGLQL